MAKVIFKPTGKSIEVAAQTKLLVAGIRLKIGIRYGCAACQCGTCAVEVKGDLSPMEADEQALLTRMKLPADGSVRLACRAKTQNTDVEVDLDFQDSYSPDDD